MPSPNLNEVTDAIVKVLEASVSRLLGGIAVTVSKLPPEKAEEAGDTRLNLYLYHVAQDMDGGNDIVRGSMDRPPVASRPLALKLFYVLTAHAMIDSVEDIAGQQTLMGWGMKSLHDVPEIDSALQINAVPIFPTIGDRTVEIILRPVAPEEAVSFWATDQVRTARLSAYYEVHTVLLPPEAPTTSNGVTAQVMLAVRPTGRPTLDATQAAIRFVLPSPLGGASLAPGRSPGVVALKPGAAPDADIVLTTTGQWLGDGRDASVVLRGDSTAGAGLPGDVAVLDPAANAAWDIAVTDTSVRLSLRATAQATTAAGAQAVVVIPGAHTLAVRRAVVVRSESGQSQTVDLQSNWVPFAIAPQVTTVTVNVANHVVVTVEQGYDAQSADAVAQLSIAGEVYRRVAAFAGTPADVGAFRVVNDHSYEVVPIFDPTLVGHTYPVRVSVNGVDSQPFWLEV